jgi:ABC-type transporter Mla subunit MlaD
MRSTVDDLKVGVAVVVGLVILVTGIMWLKNYRFGQQYESWTVVFESVGTLKTGDPVKVRGVSAGSVDGIDLVDGGAAVTLHIENDVSLHPDAVFACANLGVMGDRYIDVSPGIEPGELSKTPPPRGVYEAGISDIAAEVAHLVSKTEELIGIVTGDLSDEDLRESAKNTLLNAERATAGAAGFFEQNGRTLRRATDDLATTLEHTRRFFDEHGEPLGRAVDDAGAALASARGIVESSEHIVVALDSAAAAITEMHGTAGRMIHEHELYDALLRAVSNADSLIADIRANPKDYLSLRVF